MMARAAAFALIEQLDGTRMNLKAYCAQQGIPYGTMMARFQRMGISPGRELQIRRVQRAIDIKARHPRYSWQRSAEAAGFPFAANFWRLRRSLEARGYRFTFPNEPTADERLAQALLAADTLATTVERALRDRSTHELQRAVVEYRVAASHIDRPETLVA
jgi:hypothetical protein